MSVLAVGLSHASAPLAVLERAAVTGDALGKLADDIRACDAVAGSFVLSTCNRVEVYADADKFHGAVAAICELLGRHSGVAPAELAGYLYVHYEDRAVQHLLSVACGLESMAIGEPQILGQVRGAVRLARQRGTLTRELADLGVVAVRAGRRAQAETGIGSAGPSLVSRGLELATAHLDRTPGAAGALSEVAVLVVGAGSASSLAVATAARLGAGPIVVANRTPGRARRLAEAYGAQAAALSDLAGLLPAADLVISCTGAAAPLITRADAAAAAGGRRASRPLVLLDLALPRDIEAGTGKLAGVRLIDMDTIRSSGGTPAHESAVAAVREIVAEELGGYVGSGRAASVAPTVVALRARAGAVVDAELARLDGRLGSLDASTRREIAKSMSRIADKLLHAPTVRVKELADSPVADSYEAALRVLFDLDPDAVEAVIRADASAPPRSRQETP